MFPNISMNSISKAHESTVYNGYTFKCCADDFDNRLSINEDYILIHIKKWNIFDLF